MTPLLSAFIFVQAMIAVPAVSPTAAPSAPPDPGRLSLVIATTVSETDPQKLCADPACTALYLGHYKQARTLAGTPFPDAFSARVEMGSPWNQPYRLAMIIERREGQEPLVRVLAGFNERTGRGCFDARETETLRWNPVGPGITTDRGIICVDAEPSD